MLDYRESVWTRRTLERLLQSDFGESRMIVVSNREPYLHRAGAGGVECVRPAGGLTSALDPILQATGGVWVAHGSGECDRETADAHGRVRVPPGSPSYTLRRVWLDRETEQRYYYGLANQGLWPLCHLAYHRPVFQQADWESYRRANRLFADAVLEEADGEPAVVFIQDYHFGLLARMLKERNPHLTVAQFWHIPWPNREVFRAFPWKEELLDGLLGNDLLGFHLPNHCRNFLETIDRGLEARVDAEHGDVWRRGRATRVRPFPISIDFDQHAREASGPAVAAHRERWRKRLGEGHRFLGIGIDRSDYTKGIPDRLHAVDRLLERHPEYRGKLLFLQVAVPSRCEIPDYKSLRREVETLCRKINRKWQMGSWRPIRLCNRYLPPSELMALHQLADFCMVTSLHDGMNLVSKEYAASREDEDGVLVLSRFAGAAHELNSALLVNPFSVDEMSEAVHTAMTMPREERRRRMRALRQTVRKSNIYTWAGCLMRTLADVAADRRPAEPRLLALASGL